MLRLRSSESSFGVAAAGKSGVTFLGQRLAGRQSVGSGRLVLLRLPFQSGVLLLQVHSLLLTIRNHILQMRNDGPRFVKMTTLSNQFFLKVFRLKLSLR